MLREQVCFFFFASSFVQLWLEARGTDAQLLVARQAVRRLSLALALALALALCHDGGAQANGSHSVSVGAIQRLCCAVRLGRCDDDDGVGGGAIQRV